MTEKGRGVDMAEPLNAYRDWLRIDADAQPPDHYALLGLALFEGDEDLIRQRHAERFERIWRYRIGTYQDQAQRALDELSRALTCLTDTERKREYDDALRAQIATWTTRPDTAVVTGTLIDAVPAKPQPEIPPVVVPPFPPTPVAVLPVQQFVSSQRHGAKPEYQQEPARPPDFRPRLSMRRHDDLRLTILLSLFLLASAAGFAHLVNFFSSSTLPPPPEDEVERSSADAPPLVAEHAVSDQGAVWEGSLLQVVGGHPQAAVRVLVSRPDAYVPAFEAICDDPDMLRELADFVPLAETDFHADVVQVQGPRLEGRPGAPRLAPDQDLPVIRLERITHRGTGRTAKVGWKRPIKEFAIPLEQVEHLERLRESDQPVRVVATIIRSHAAEGLVMATKIDGRNFWVRVGRAWEREFSTLRPGQDTALVVRATEQFMEWPSQLASRTARVLDAESVGQPSLADVLSNPAARADQRFKFPARGSVVFIQNDLAVAQITLRDETREVDLSAMLRAKPGYWAAVRVWKNPCEGLAEVTVTADATNPLTLVAFVPRQGERFRVEFEPWSSRSAPPPVESTPPPIAANPRPPPAPAAPSPPPPLPPSEIPNRWLQALNAAEAQRNWGEVHLILGTLSRMKVTPVERRQVIETKGRLKQEARRLWTSFDVQLREQGYFTIDMLDTLQEIALCDPDTYANGPGTKARRLLRTQLRQ